MRFLRQSMTGLFITALAVGLLVYAAQTIGSAVQERMADVPGATGARERVFAVNTVVAQPATVRPVLETFGEIEARRRLELRTAVGGRIVALSEAFENGGRVEAGELLLRIDPSETQAAVARLSVDLQDAEAEQRDAARGLTLARDELAAAEDQGTLRTRAFQRQSDLADRGVGTSTAIEEAELAAAVARANVLSRRQALAQAEARVDLARTGIERARIALEEARRNLADTEISARFEGIISDTQVVEGGLLAANERLGELIDPTDLEVAFRVSTAQFARLIDEEGRLVDTPVSVSLTVAGIDLETRGTLARVDAATGEGQTGRVLFAHLEAARGFRPGDFVTVRALEPPVENVVRLPASALGADGNVLVLSADDRLELLQVRLLRRQGDDVLVRSPLLDGREVVVARTPLLGPGVLVRPLRSQEESTVSLPEMLELTEERRARLMAFIDASDGMPADAKTRMRAQLAEPEVPADVVERLERRMGG